jgi:glucose/arabinose dehydrogenase
LVTLGPQRTGRVCAQTLRRLHAWSRPGADIRAWVGLATLVLVLMSEARASAQVFPPDFTEDVVTALELPVDFAFLPDGRTLLVEKPGIVRVYKNGALVSTPVIDLRAKVNNYWDRGMLGIAADPSFATNGYVYLYYVYEHDATNFSGPKTVRLTRITMVGDTAAPSSEVVILGALAGDSCGGFPVGADCIPADSPSHNGGQIRFAADGTLFLSTGDGASFNVVDPLALRAQQIDSLAGKLLHITRTGQGVATNPFWSGSATANRSKVWSYGFRNPFRFGLRPTNGTPYVGDVGWSTTEEVNVATAGTNFGWPCYEGSVRQAGYEPLAECQALYAKGATAVRSPLYEYQHDGASASITGGVFYNATAYPSAYQDAYFFGDSSLGFLRYLRVDANDSLVGTVGEFATGVAGPVAIELGSDGSLYYAAVNGGELRRIRYRPTQPDAAVTYISNMTWTSMVNGWGPAERDRSNGETGAIDGTTLTLNGTTYDKGVGVHAGSDIRIVVPAVCTTFVSDVGVDDEVGSLGSVVFEVWADGIKLFDSGVMTGTTPTNKVNVSVSGRNELALIVRDGGNGNSSDHADWADAQLRCTGSTDPIVASVSPDPYATDVDVNTNVSATFSEAMDATTLTTSTVTLTAQGGSRVAASVTYDAATKTVTLDPAAALAAGASPTARIRGGATGVKTLSGNTLAADYVWTFTTKSAPSGGSTTTYVSDLTWTSTVNGWGPVEKDRSNGEAGSGDGATLTLNGVTYSKGLGVHAASTVRYALTTCSTFAADIGVDDEVGATGSVVLQVWGDTTLLYDSGVMTGTSPTKSIVVDVTGRTQLGLTVTDGGDGVNNDHADWAIARITCQSANSPPQPTITAPPSTYLFKVGDVITYSGSATDHEDGSIPDAALAWQVVLHHCPGGVCHIHPFQTTTGPSGSFTVPDHGDESYFELILTATDSAGASTTVTRNIQPKTVLLTLSTSPSGLQVVDGGFTGTGPMTRTTIAGSTHTISVPSPQSGYTFSSWSDGGALQHNVTLADNDVTLTAMFTDTAPPTITGVTPASGATGVAVGTNVTATFSEAMAPATLTTATMTLMPNGGSAVAATVTYDQATRRATLDPTTNLAFSTVYTATVKGGASGAKDAAGNALVADVTWTFTTAAAPDTTPPVISAVRATKVNASQTEITWTTNEPADSEVLYGRTTAYGSTSGLVSTLVTSHTVRLRNLQKGTQYHFKVKSRDAAGNVQESADFTFTQ